MTMVINQGIKAQNKNVRQGGGTKQVTKVTSLFFHPANYDFISNADLATPQASIQAALVHANPLRRAIFIKNLIVPEPAGQAPGYEQRDGYNFKSDKGTWEMRWQINGTYSDYLKIKEWAKYGKRHRFILGGEDSFIRHQTTSTGIRGHRTHEVEVLPLTEPIPGAAVKYILRVAAASIDEIAEADMTDLTFNPETTLEGIEDVKLTLGTSGTNGTFRVALKGIADEVNFANEYQLNTELRQAGAFSFVNAAGATIGITAVNLVKQGNEVVAFDIVANTGSNYTPNQKGYIKLSAPATIAGYTNGVYMESNELEVTLT